MSSNRTKIDSLEGTRAVLAMVVFFAHSWLSFIGPLDGLEVTVFSRIVSTASTLAVTCFFVLSGYVIALSIMANRARNDGVFKPLDYFAARCFRILPPLLVTMGLCWLLAMGLGLVGATETNIVGAERERFAVSLLPQFVALVSVSVLGELEGGINGPLWSLLWEIRFYVFAGLLAVAAWGKGVSRVVGALGALVYAWLLELTDPLELGIAVPLFVYFGLGAVVALIKPGVMTRRSLVWSALMLLVASAGIGWLVGEDLFVESLRPASISLEMLTAMWFVLVILAVQQLHWLAGLAPLGAVSYTLYILHFPVLQAMYFVLANHAPGALQGAGVWLTWPVATMVTLWVCGAVGRAVEQPAAQRAFVAALVNAGDRRSRVTSRS
ncbi:acyltransferase [Methylibium sp. Root1272]|uniref:acyltransferase family protein n=1 Tax=Methylibium sp. Root1272 TaxID=1736441 RepID=UPI0012E82F82|nr:acyltransferase [Methylibium sp. Root1272]